MSTADQQGGVGIQVRNLFATPIANFRVPDAVRINDALERRIFEREREVASAHHSNLGGWQSPTDLETWCGPEGETILNLARKMATALTCDRPGQPVSPDWRMNCWANVNRAGQANEFHTHPGAFWSASYHVRDGGAASNPVLGGEFEMADPRGFAPAMLAPRLCFETPGGQSIGASELAQPTEGMLMLFPSWLSHAVRPYLGNAVRISIAMNFTL